MLLFLKSRPLKPEVEIDVDGVALASWHRQQPLARAERKITRSEGIIAEIDLSGQSTVARCFHEKVNVSRTLAVTPQRAHQLVGSAAGGHCITARHLGAEGIAAIIAELYATAVVERALHSGRIEMRIEARGICMPNVEYGSLHGFAIWPNHLPAHVQRGGILVGILGQVDIFAFG